MTSGSKTTVVEKCRITLDGYCDPPPPPPQAKDLAIFRARSSGLEEEMKNIKALMEAQHLQKLREDNALLSTQVTQL